MIKEVLKAMTTFITAYPDRPITEEDKDMGRRNRDKKKGKEKGRMQSANPKGGSRFLDKDMEAINAACKTEGKGKIPHSTLAELVDDNGKKGNGVYGDDDYGDGLYGGFGSTSLMGGSSHTTQGGKAGQSYTGGYTSCKHPPTEYLTFGEGTERALTVWSGKESDIYKGLAKDAAAGKILYMDLTNYSSNNSGGAVNSCPPGWKAFFEEYEADEICMSWPDQGKPRVPASFWRRFILEVQERGYRHLVVYCVGGHGRTGTALACIELVADPTLTDKQAISNVRKFHCNKAVESKTQDDYIASVADYAHANWTEKQPEKKAPHVPAKAAAVQQAAAK